MIIKLSILQGLKSILNHFKTIRPRIENGLKKNNSGNFYFKRLASIYQKIQAPYISILVRAEIKNLYLI